MKHSYHIFLLLLFILSSCVEDIDKPLVVTEVTTTPNPVSACGIAFTVRDTAYMITGRDGTKVTNDVWRFDAALSNWTKISKFPGIRRINMIAEVVNGKVYVGLGYNPASWWGIKENFLKDIWRYDPALNTWDSVRTIFPGTETNNAVSFVYDNEIFILHGFESHIINSQGFSRKVRKYSVKDNTWTVMNDFPGYMRTSAVAVTNGKQIFAGTGYATWNEYDWWEYLPQTDSWEKRKRMPDKGRINASAFTVNNRIFVTGGRYFAGKYTAGHVKKEIMEYVPDEDKWYVAGELPQGTENAFTFVVGKEAYVGYGEDDTVANVKLWKCTGF
jgi:N-acetylneuraminic acid mutarotase